MMSQSQLEWRCRRGVRELDVLFARFLKNEYTNLNQQQQKSFQRLTEVQDPTIMDWLFAKTQSEDKEIQLIISKLQKLSESIC